MGGAVLGSVRWRCCTLGYLPLRAGSCEPVTATNPPCRVAGSIARTLPSGGVGFAGRVPHSVSPLATPSCDSKFTTRVTGNLRPQRIHINNKRVEIIPADAILMDIGLMSWIFGRLNFVPPKSPNVVNITNNPPKNMGTQSKYG